AAAHAPSGMAMVCPPGSDPSSDVTPCFALDTNLTAYRALMADPGVESGRVTSAAAVQAVGRDGTSSQTMAQVLVAEEGAIERPELVHGRLPASGAADEVQLTERTAAALGVHVGDPVPVVACAATIAEGPSSCDEHTTVTVVGIVRDNGDLVPVATRPPGA